VSNFRRERILPGTEEMWRHPESLRKQHEVYRAKGVIHYGRHRGLYKVGSLSKPQAIDAGYTLVREGTYYAYVQAPEASKS